MKTETPTTKTHTKGNVIVEEIKIGDIHYEYDMGLCFKSKVVELPKWIDTPEATGWEWVSEGLRDGKPVTYFVDPRYTHYSVNLYDYEAYHGCTEV